MVAKCVQCTRHFPIDECQAVTAVKRSFHAPAKPVSPTLWETDSPQKCFKVPGRTQTDRAKALEGANRPATEAFE